MQRVTKTVYFINSSLFFSLQKFRSLFCLKILRLNRVFIFRANNDLYLDSYNYDIYTFPGSISTRWTTNLAPLERVITIQNNLSLWSLSDTLCYHLKDGFSLGIMQDDINVLTSPYSRHITYVDYSFPAVLCVETVIIVLYFLSCQCRAYNWRECVFWTFFSHRSLRVWIWRHCWIRYKVQRANMGTN